MLPLIVIAPIFSTTFCLTMAVFNIMFAIQNEISLIIALIAFFVCMFFAILNFVVAIKQIIRM